MRKKKYLILVLPLILLGVLALPQITGAWEMPEEYMTPVADDEVLPQTDLMTVIANVIRWVLGFLGLIAVILIIVGGFMWMTSGGQEEKIGKAKKLMTNGIIGLVIVLLAYIIANFIIQALESEIFVE